MRFLPTRAPHPVVLAAALLLAVGGCGGGPTTDAVVPLEDPVRDLQRSEDVASDVETHVLAALAHAAVQGDADAVAAHLHDDFRGGLPAPEAGAVWEDDRATILETGPDLEGGLGDPLDADDFVERLAEHVAALGAIERIEFELDRFRLSADGTRATGRAALRYGGGFMTGERTTWRAEFGLELLYEEERWRLTAAVLKRGTRVTTVQEPFRDVSDWTGFRTHDSRENRELAQRLVDRRRTQAMGGLTVVDWNRDGFPDVLVTRSGQSAVLLRNDGRGGFVPENTPFGGPRLAPAHALVVDLDGDGHDEVVGTTPLGYEGATTELGLWVRRGDGWARRPRALVLPNPVGLRRLAVQTVVPFDADDDGDLDLFVAVYGSHLSRGEHYNTVEAHDGADNHLLIQEEPLVFREASAERGLDGTQYTYVALAFDFDDDGDVDLFEGNDFGPNVLWANDGDGHFTRDTSLKFADRRGYTMGATLGDPDGEGRWSLYVSNMSSEPGGRIVDVAEGFTDRMRRSLEHIAGGNALHVQGPDGWPDVGSEAGCAEAEWAWGCVFFDPDNDGDQDLVVTNGFTSHRRRANGDWQTYYWRQVVRDAHLLEAGRPTEDVNAGQRFEGSFNGYERDRLFLNPGGAAPRAGRRFVEAGWNFGLDGDHDGRAVAPIDMDGDGDLDLALWTLQGLQLLENRMPHKNFVRFGLRAVDGHPSGLGAIVEVRANGRLQRDHVTWTDGFQTQVLPELHFGLGDHAGPVDVTVHWPGGRTQRWEAVPSGGFVELTEGEREPLSSPLRRWPERVLPQGPPPEGAHLVELATGESAPLARPGKVTVVRLGGTRNPKRPWPQAHMLSARARAPELVWVPGKQPAPDHDLPGAVTITAAGTDRITDLIGSQTIADGVLVFDRERRLARAFIGAPRLRDLEAILDELEEEDPYPDLLVEDGRLALAEGRFREAGVQFERALAGDPTRTDAWDGLARHHLAFGRDVRAFDAWTRAVEQDPEYALGHLNLGIAHQGRGALDPARTHLERAVDLAPKDVRAWLALAECAALQGDLERTVAACEEASQLDAGPAPRVLQGKALGQLRRLEEARHAFEDALLRDPDASEAKAGLRRVRQLLGEIPEDG